MLKKLLVFGVLIIVGGGATAGNTAYKPPEMVASWYMHGTRTANGERFDPQGMTVAHKTLPFNTRLRLTRKNKSVIVRVNDRGPFLKGRQLDLSRGVAQHLGCVHSGVCRVTVELLDDRVIN